MESSSQKYWSEYPFPSPVDLPDIGIEPSSPALQADSLLSEPPGKPFTICICISNHHTALFKYLIILFFFNSIINKSGEERK